MSFSIAVCEDCEKEFKVQRNAPSSVICPECFGAAAVCEGTVIAGDSGKWGSPVYANAGSDPEVFAENASDGRPATFDVIQSHEQLHVSHIELRSSHTKLRSKLETVLYELKDAGRQLDYLKRSEKEITSLMRATLALQETQEQILRKLESLESRLSQSQ